LVEKTATFQDKNKCTSKLQRNKILIIGDSHTRGCAAELSTSLGKTFEVTVAVLPGSRLEHVMCLACRQLSQLHCDDFIVIWGGEMTLTEMNPTVISDTSGNSHSETNIHMSLQ